MPHGIGTTTAHMTNGQHHHSSTTVRTTVSFNSGFFDDENGHLHHTITSHNGNVSHDDSHLSKGFFIFLFTNLFYLQL
jgi:hypothetical protein